MSQTHTVLKMTPDLSDSKQENFLLIELCALPTMSTKLTKLITYGDSVNTV